MSNSAMYYLQHTKLHMQNCIQDALLLSKFDTEETQVKWKQKYI